MRATLVTLLPLTLSLMSGVAMAATVYKWVDERGITHYSDQPHPQAQELNVQPKNLVSAQESAPASSSESSSTPPPNPSYRCSVVRPEPDEVFLNTTTVGGRLQVQPDLTDGEQVAITVDGKRMPTRGTDFVISDVERGTHTLVATVYDRSGTQQLCVTQPITFHVRQPSVQAPVKAVRPKF